MYFSWAMLDRAQSESVTMNESITSAAAGRSSDRIVCRAGCGACCIAPSITSPLPGMPYGKPAGVRCINLDQTNRCHLWNTALLPTICRSFPPLLDVCGHDAAEAMVNLTVMEMQTSPYRSAVI